MHLWEVIIISTGMSLEAFNIAIKKGANQRQLPGHMLFLVSLLFGATAMVMLAAGMKIAGILQGWIHVTALTEVSRWCSTIILLLLGMKMFFNARRDRNTQERREENITYKEAGLMAIRAGVDVIFLGMVFGFLQTAVLSIYIVFVIVSLMVGLGLWLGERLGSQYRYIASICSGILLIIMGLKFIITSFR